MSGELEAAGAMATAGLIAGAIEGREAREGGEGACTNCGAALGGNYCANCGQASHPHRTMAHVFEEFLHGVLHFDTKAWRTLPMVVFRPGTLTRNYVYGKRARYISPLALFLFTVFLMFFAFAFIQTPPGLSGTPDEQRAEAVLELEEAREELNEAQRELDEARAAPPPTDGTPAGLEVQLAEQAVRLAQDELDRRQTWIEQIDRTIARQAAESGREQEGVTVEVRSSGSGEDAPAQEGAPAEHPAPDAAAEAEPEFEGAGWAPGETWQDGARRMAERDDFVVIQGWDSLNERIRKKFENPDLAVYKIQQAAYKFSFLLVPISLPFVALLFLWRRGLTLYDHAVYTLYGLAFASILFVTIVFASMSIWTEWMTGWLIAFG
ncbi:MAG: DUF3667 domain-containing protein, partial [Hyphomonadaceae bacterium]